MSLQGVFLLSFGEGRGDLNTLLWISATLSRGNSLADKWETRCSFPFSHLQMFVFLALAKFFYFSNM